MLDELNGRPLGTKIPGRLLVALGVSSLAGACAIGVWAASSWGYGLLGFVAVGAFIVPAYNLEWFGGRFHTAWWLALAWGAFPVLTAYFAQAQSLRRRCRARGRIRDRADPRPAHALDPGPPRPAHARDDSTGSSRWNRRSASFPGPTSSSAPRSSPRA